MEDTSNPREEPTRATVLKIVLERPRITVSDAREELINRRGGEINRSTVADVLERLEFQGLVSKQYRKGTDGRGAPGHSAVEFTITAKGERLLQRQGGVPRMYARDTTPRKK